MSNFKFKLYAYNYYICDRNIIKYNIGIYCIRHCFIIFSYVIPAKHNVAFFKFESYENWIFKLNQQLHM